MMPDPKVSRFYARISGAVMLKIALMALGYWVGSTLDERFHTYPYLMLLGLVIGAGFGIWFLVRVADKSQQ